MLRTASVSILPWLWCAGKNGMPAYHARRGPRPSGAAALHRRATRRVKAPGKPGRSPRPPRAQNALSWRGRPYVFSAPVVSVYPSAQRC